MNLQVDVKDIKKWVQALRSGKYSQTKKVLNDQNGFCCLGVACDIFIPEDKQQKNDGHFTGNFPNQQLYSPEWLVLINSDFYIRTGIGLSDLNDGTDEIYFKLEEDGTIVAEKMSLTFDEIADLLELVYIHKVLG